MLALVLVHDLALVLVLALVHVPALVLDLALAAVRYVGWWPIPRRRSCHGQGITRQSENTCREGGSEWG